ncbi:PQQ-binding-like beta-propeller repeat protein [Stieleria sp. TO1_6]|uniref:outer membrane protein assembly factor BamB family protein n=1 Tax=Stieleria tagensis TaxID=2956795 RepID=UPI00209B452F|nr:PQQ-binding-like beta-propeller repeat protein [Stieleria tagensis]MCO8123086.1 PQQ-binding-like beta-propeller repeat protein [Stieleria tagensis]
MNHHQSCNGIRTVASCIAVILCLSPASADWPSFRNGGNSRVSEPLPTQWSSSSGIAWQTETQGYGQSSPVIHSGLIFTTSVIGPMCETCLIECHELKSGELRWSYQHDSTHGHPSNYMNARAAPTPVVDERGVYAFFETGDFVAVDLHGQKLWARDESSATGKFDNSHGIGSSLAQNETHVFLNLEHGGPSFLLAIEKASGETTWSVDRPSSKSWSSPIVADVDGQQQVIVSSGGTVAGYDVASGEMLWMMEGIEGNSVPSPTVSGNYLVVGARLPEFAEDGAMQSNCCLDLSQISDGKPRVLWRADKAICEYASPVIVDGFAYFLSKANVLHCLNVVSGEVAYRKRLGSDCWATPIVSGNRLYFFCKNGRCHVVIAGPEHKTLATHSLWNSEDPPKPETYTETARDSSHEQDSSSSGGPGGGMAARMKAGDANGDGVLQGDEISERIRPMLSRVDTNGDGKLDASEIDAMAASFAERRKDSAATSRDPIVYGVAASDGHIIVRTGTRLFAIGS